MPGTGKNVMLHGKRVTHPVEKVSGTQPKKEKKK
jgi:hypothetical protein